MKTQHTPGPWRIDKSFRASVNDSSGNCLADCWDDIAGRKGPANARLIAAAPELLQALQTISGWSKCQCTEKHGDNPNCCVLVAETAIAKVEGN